MLPPSSRLVTPGLLAGLSASLLIAACSVANAPDDPIDPSSSGTAGAGAQSGAGGQGAGPSCGDGTVDSDEQCDDAGESADCNADCTDASCGDSVLNATAGEQCDPGGETEDCNADCTLAQCGDEYINVAAGEECDDLQAAGAGCCTTDSCTYAQNCNSPLDLMLMPAGMNQFESMTSCPLGGPGEVPEGPCDGSPAGSGGEQVYHFNLPAPSGVQIQLTADFDAILRMTSSACDLSSEVPEGPTDDGCSNVGTTGAMETLNYTLLVPGDYFIIVDGANAGDSGTFNLQVVVNEISNPILNPSFETQNYDSWTLMQMGSPNSTIQMVQPLGQIMPGQTYTDLFDAGMSSSSSPALPFMCTPSDGQYAAVWISDGPDTRRMYQDIVVSGSTLEFDMAHFNSDMFWNPGSQHIAINIRDPQSDAILGTPFLTDANFPPINATMTTYTVNLTPWLGQSVRLDVEVQGQNFFLDAVFDNFTIF